jgi:hypothetical protein
MVLQISDKKLNKKKKKKTDQLNFNILKMIVTIKPTEVNKEQNYKNINQS